MSKATAILSMLHETRPGADSATRLFRDRPVLWWTLQRLAGCHGLDSLAILCWEEQLAEVEPIAADRHAHILAKGPRIVVPQVQAIAAARKWCDGWRGSLLGACAFDQGFFAPWVNEIVQELESESIILIDPASGLVDPELIDALIAHAAGHDDTDFFFSPATPGLGSAMLRRTLVEQLAAAQVHPGRFISYLPDQPCKDPLGNHGCAPVPTPVARTTHRLLLDSDRQIRRISDATIALNGELIRTEAEELVRRVSLSDTRDPLPRDVTLELNVERATRPIYWPGGTLNIRRNPLPVAAATKLFAELAALDDIRLTLGGVGDPLLSPDVLAIIEAAHNAGISSIHVETDLLAASPKQIEQLAAAPVDIISIFIPATTVETYQAIMGVDGFAATMESIRVLAAKRHERKTGLPLIVPTLVKCPQNLGEMELWYDQWIRVLGAATVVGPSSFAGQFPSCAVADMAPPRRRACARLASRLTILCDGQVVACEEDVTARRPLGKIGQQSIREIWTGPAAEVWRSHSAGKWDGDEQCAACQEWHRP